MRFDGGPMDGQTKLTEAPWPLPEELDMPEQGGRYVKDPDRESKLPEMPGILRGAVFVWTEREGHQVVYCYLRQQNVSVEECTTSCGAPEMRPQCWADKGIAQGFEGDRELPVLAPEPPPPEPTS